MDEKMHDIVEGGWNWKVRWGGGGWVGAWVAGSWVCVGIELAAF